MSSVIQQEYVVIREYERGVVKGNPKFCLRCGQRIGKDDAWTKTWSMPEADGSRYATIRHNQCPKPDKMHADNEHTKRIGAR